jgi:entericidin B
MTRILCIIAALCFLAGCNTIEGMGKDIKAGGEKVEKSADKNKGY